MSVSELFDPDAWVLAPGAEGYTDITSHVSPDGRIARIAFDRPEVRNAFRPHTVDELYRALDIARQDSKIGVVLLTGNGPSPKDGGWAFCSGGDQRIRGRDGYTYAADDATAPDPARSGRLHILEVQRLIRFMPKVVIAVIPGWAAGGGHSLHVVCDLSIASREHGRFSHITALSSFMTSSIMPSIWGRRFASWWVMIFSGPRYSKIWGSPDTFSSSSFDQWSTYRGLLAWK